jgi:glycosyltransferase involved in cell wall biosynthesis
LCFIPTQRANCFVDAPRFLHNQEMTPQPRVTVIVDSYNYGRFIEEAIDSVLSQDFPLDQVELIVVDDGSTDDTAERVRKYGSRVQYLYKPNGGQASAFNLGFAQAQGEILVLLDADDYLLPGKLQHVVAEFDRHPDVGMVYHRLREFDTRTGKYREGYFKDISGNVPANSRDLLSYVLYPTSALAFRRLSVAPLFPIPETLSIQADSHLTGLIIFLAPVLALPECLGVYRVHGHNLYYPASSAIDLERTRRRMATRDTLVADMKTWLVEHGHDLASRDLHALFMQWRLTQEGDEFILQPPSRLRFFRHLWQYNRYFRARMNARHLATNYLQTFASLLFGYQHLESFNDWLVRVRGMLHRRPPDPRSSPGQNS